MRSGLVTAWRFASCPTSRSPVFVNATTDGVVRDPSELAMTVGSALPSRRRRSSSCRGRCRPLLPLGCVSRFPSDADQPSRSPRGRRRPPQVPFGPCHLPSLKGGEPMPPAAALRPMIRRSDRMVPGRTPFRAPAGSMTDFWHSGCAQRPRRPRTKRAPMGGALLASLAAGRGQGCCCCCCCWMYCSTGCSPSATSTFFLIPGTRCAA